MRYISIAEDAIQTWLRGTPPDSVTASSKKTDFERIFQITPTNKSSCLLTLHVDNSSGLFDILLPQGSQFDDLKLDPALIVEILDTVALGKVQEANLMWRKKSIMTKAKLRLKRGTWTTKRAILWCYLLRFLPPKPTYQVIRYEPYW